MPTEVKNRAQLFADQAYQALLDRIVTLQLPPGSPLREDALMDELDLGRTPLREAVKRLALENFVAVQPRRGTFVTEVDTADIIHITEVRAELEGFAAERAARRIDDDGRVKAAALRDSIAELQRGAGQDGLMRLDERVHRFIWQAADNRYLYETLEHYFQLSKRTWYLVLDRAPGLGQVVHEQDQVFDALLAGDGRRAGAILREHVLEFQREVLAALSRD